MPPYRLVRTSRTSSPHIPLLSILINSWIVSGDATNAGIAAIVVARMLGSRRGFPNELRPPHNPGMVMIGATMLWVGWFGFNAGSELAADGTAGMAMAVTQIASAAAALG